ncbi:MAG TPA: sigma-70 family RNA polymerase sigma factor [Actinomycetota bacterium]|nr:sigma-70 family RNA polymerase sigma factor [Actinomycetota bacterium]
MAVPAEAVIDRLMARDPDALREIADEYGSLVYGVARRVLADAGLAEEVAQDVFVALWRRPGAYDPSRGSLGRFLAGVARNKAIDAVRKEESVRRTASALMSEMETASREVSPTEQIDERRRVSDALARLAETQREALVLAYFGGRTYREVAEELGIPEGTAKTRLRDGLIKLRAILAEGGSEA